MKATLILLAATAMLHGLPAQAQSKNVSAADCVRQADAQKLVGTQRTAFMNKCLGTAAAIQKPNPNHDRLMRCRADADRRRLEGAARESYLSGCQN